MKKTNMVVHLYTSPFIHESRMQREFHTLRKNKIVQNVIVIAVSRDQLPKLEKQKDGFIIIHRFDLEKGLEFLGPFTRLIGLFFWSKRVKKFLLQKNDMSLIHCHSLSVLPIAVFLKKRFGIPILYDAHELESERAGAGIFRRIVSRISEKKLLKYVDETWVVGDEISRWYKQVQDVQTTVVYNYPLVKKGIQSTDGLGSQCYRVKFNIPPKAIVYLYQGALGRGRGVNRLVSWFENVDNDRAHLVFMGEGPFKDIVVTAANGNDNIHYHPAVPSDVVLQYTSTADIGLTFIEPICLSYRYCLPNKLFEYLQAGIAVWASDLPEMKRVVNDVGNGILLDENISKNSAIDLINSTTIVQVEKWKQAARAKQSSYRWELMEPIIVDTYSRLLK